MLKTRTNKIKKHIIIIYPQPSENQNVIPLGPIYLAESLLKKGYIVSIIDGAVDKILESIHNKFTDNVVTFAISSLSGTQLKNGIIVAKILKTCYSHIPIVFGGAHVNALPLQTLEADCIDYVVWGEGEITFPILINAINTNGDLSNIPGIGYTSNKRAIINKRSDFTPLNERVFDLPYNLIDMEKYCRKKMLIGLEKEYYVFTSRGCPYNCYFCSNSSKIWSNNKMRYHTIEHIINDITRLVDEYGADGITIGDENFFVNDKRVIAVCNALIQTGLNKKVRFRGNGRADSFSKMPSYSWELLKDAGFVAFGVGIESGSQRMLDVMGKKITLEQIHKTDELLTKYSFYKTYLFMTCVPGETIEDIDLTLELIIALAKTSKYCPYPIGRMSKYIPLPGTKLFDICVDEYGFKPPDSIEGWINFDLHNFIETTNTVRPWLSKELLQYINKANYHIETLNSLFVGKNRDEDKIDTMISTMEIWMVSLKRQWKKRSNGRLKM